MNGKGKKKEKTEIINLVLRELLPGDS